MWAHTRRLAAIGLAVLAVVLFVSALSPAPARAWIIPGLPSPGQVIKDLLGAAGQVIGGSVGKLAVTAFDAVIHALFAPIAHFVNTQLLGWLVAVPDYAPAGSHVAATEQTVLAMAGAALGAVATISIARFWATGLAGHGASAFEGLARVVGAALLLPVWPWIFHALIALSNDASSGLLGSASVTKASANLLAVGVGAGVGLGFLGVGLFVAIVMAVVASVLLLGLLLMKVVLAISTVLVFIGMPVAIVLSPVVSWLPRVIARAFLVCLAVPLVWALCFAASGAMLNDGLFLKGPSGLFDALLEPVAAIALLWVVVVLPAKLAQLAMLGASTLRGGFVSRVASYAAGSHLREVARERLPGWAGGRSETTERRRSDTDSRLGARLRAESALAEHKASGGERAAGVAGVGAAAGAATANGANGASHGAADHASGWLSRLRAANPRAYSRPALADAQARSASGGLKRPSWRQDDYELEMLEASLREQHQPVSAEQASAAREALPSATQAAVGQLVSDQGPRARQHLAYQALGEWTPSQREAIRTLAAATPEVRAQAFGQGSLAGFGERSEPATGGAPSTGLGVGARSAPSPAPPTQAPSAVTDPGSGAPGPRTPSDQSPPDGGAGR